MSLLSQLLKNNKKWADSIHDKEPDFFSRLSQKQSPSCLWIGCSDSRVPESQILNLAPGNIFTHRNIANLVSKSDLNIQAVISHAIINLEIEHILICGHYGCSGINAALHDDSASSALNDWVLPIKSLKERNTTNLEDLDASQQNKTLAELNVMHQVENLSQFEDVEIARQAGKSVTIYGLIYDMETGLLRELIRK